MIRCKLVKPSQYRIEKTIKYVEDKYKVRFIFANYIFDNVYLHFFEEEEMWNKR